jgi:hypothetical protein
VDSAERGALPAFGMGLTSNIRNGEGPEGEWLRGLGSCVLVCSGQRKFACPDRVGKCRVRRGQGSRRIWEIDRLVTRRYHVADVGEGLLILRIVGLRAQQASPKNAEVLSCADP